MEILLKRILRIDFFVKHVVIKKKNIILSTVRKKLNDSLTIDFFSLN